MKKKVSLILAMMAFLTACSNPADETNARMKELNEQLKRDLEDFDKKLIPSIDADEAVRNALKLSKTAGSITVEGIVVARQGSQFILDPRISVAHYDKDEAGQKIPALKKELKLSDTTSAKMTEAVNTARTFINLGCTDLSAADKGDLKEISLPSANQDKASKSDTSPIFLSVEASRIFICGEFKVPVAYMFIVTQDLRLKDAQINTQDTVGLLTLVTNSLSLAGKNSLTSQGSNSETAVLAAPALSLYVREELRGQGNLAIASVSGGQTPKERLEQKQDSGAK